MSTSKCPWGNFEVLYDGDDCKVKRITVDPNCRLSYQSHSQRSEIWVIVSGYGKFTMNDKESLVFPEMVMGIPQGAKHRIENVADHESLVFVETQLGTYFGEDDIIRFEDDYGRHRPNWYRDDDLD